MAFWFTDQHELDAAVADIDALPPAARNLLARLVESQEAKVSKVSPSAERLFDLGFLHIWDAYDGATMQPSLYGEEALSEWEDRRGIRRMGS